MARPYRGWFSHLFTENFQKHYWGNTFATFPLIQSFLEAAMNTYSLVNSTTYEGPGLGEYLWSVWVALAACIVVLIGLFVWVSLSLLYAPIIPTHPPYTQTDSSIPSSPQYIPDWRLDVFLAISLRLGESSLCDTYLVEPIVYDSRFFVRPIDQYGMHTRAGEKRENEGRIRVAIKVVPISS